MNAGGMASGWFYLKAGEPGAQQVGPVTWEQLWELARTGAITPGDMVWHEDLPGWVPAAQVPVLFPGAPAPAQTQYAASTAARPTARRHSRLLWVIPLVLVVCVGVALGLYFGLRGGGDGPGLTAGPSTGPTVPPGEPGTWLVMIYSDADDELIEYDLTFDLNEAELVGSTGQVTIVAQVDRFLGGYDGEGDVTSTKRYLLTQDADLTTLNSSELADLGEVDMGDGESLYDFAAWAIRSYPAERYVLILSDHGGGWTGGWTDPDPELGSDLTMQEIDDALGRIVADTGIGAFELVGFDACLMGQLEVMSTIAPHARYAVGSEEIEPGLGWAYAGFLQALTADPVMTGQELGQAIVSSYIWQDARITDDQARRALWGRGRDAESVAVDESRPATMSAVDLSTFLDLNAALNQLAVALAGIDQGLVAQARAYSQGYYQVFDQANPPSYIDLGHFVDLLLDEVSDPDVVQAAQQVKGALAQSVTAETHGEDKPGSSGLSIYFPNSAEYTGTFSVSGDVWWDNYPSSVGRFATASLWDDYLTFHYTGETFDPETADLSVLTPAESRQTDFAEAAEESAPSSSAKVVGPGAGGLSLSPITLSASEIGPDGVVTLSSQFTGSNVAYSYYFIGYYEESDGSYLAADAGFVEPGGVKEVDGVYYPDWGDEEVKTIESRWTPTLYYMSDGNSANDQFAFFEPEVYGVDVAGDIYTVSGMYTFVDSGTQMEATIEFNGAGDMQRVLGFSEGSGSSDSGTWHEITPRLGDSFTITKQYLEFDQNPEGEFVPYDGGTMTFGDTPFTMVPYYAVPGSYILGIGLEDLDGNMSWEFAELTVTE